MNVTIACPSCAKAYKVAEELQRLRAVRGARRLLVHVDVGELRTRRGDGRDTAMIAVQILSVSNIVFLAVKQ